MAEQKQAGEHWGSRWGLIFAAMGAAIGTGNIWRFPREAAINGGGAFMIPWLLFLFSWSIPLLIAEFTIGKHTRFGTIGAFKRFAGKKYAWMGAWMMLVNIFIMFYYAVVMGWVLKYFTVAASGGLTADVDTEAMWESFVTSPAQVIFFQVLAIGISTFVVYRGIAQGIEKTNKLLIPGMFILLIIAALWALSLPGALNGLKYMFIIRGDSLGKADTWVSALSQSAFSTSAGFGMAITYAVYMKRREDTTLNAFIAGLGNNAASLIAGIAVICTVFALSTTNVEAIDVMKSGNEGLAFIHLTRLFTLMPGGVAVAGIFFLAMAFAAITSMISGMEITVRNFMDHGWSRNHSLKVTSTMMFVFGLPSALIIVGGGVPAFLKNQDHVWSFGLIVSGIFVFFAVWRYGINKFREEHINVEWNDLYIGRWWVYIMYLFPIQFMFLMLWFFSQSIALHPDSWWNPFEPEGFATIVLQWGLALAILIRLNDWINKKPMIAPEIDDSEVVEVQPEYG
ncbi:MAG: sodium-dependent transporter [Methanomassiliicoccales archaeon]|nr:MAG: sodium-dependent transporter [Methanomassiliicoccales archaeon]